MKPLRIAVVGAGAFGSNHLRVLQELPDVQIAAVVEPDETRRKAWAVPGCRHIEELPPGIDAAIVATPTQTHSAIACQLMDAGIDVLVEKPIASDFPAALRLKTKAEENQRVLQVGHLERFNPAVRALRSVVSLPLFFEIHRMSLFSPRSLDVDVILDLMIHDLDIVLSLVGGRPEEVQAAGISILSAKVDIANVRLSFPGGCVANLTASRVSTEKIRKIRVFQPKQYISVDYGRQDAASFTISEGPNIHYEQLPVEKAEPLRLELEHFLGCCRTRERPSVGADEAIRALELALIIQAKIDEHAQVVSDSVAAYAAR